jgi:hypothetical protein
VSQKGIGLRDGILAKKIIRFEWLALGKNYSISRPSLFSEQPHTSFPDFFSRAIQQANFEVVFSQRQRKNNLSKYQEHKRLINVG